MISLPGFIPGDYEEIHDMLLRSGSESYCISPAADTQNFIILGETYTANHLIPPVYGLLLAGSGFWFMKFYPCGSRVLDLGNGRHVDSIAAIVNRYMPHQHMILQDLDRRYQLINMDGPCAVRFANGITFRPDSVGNARYLNGERAREVTAL